MHTHTHTHTHTSTRTRTCRMLSSATEATTHSSEGLHAKSDTLLVCPPWMNSSSGGPSSDSSGACAGVWVSCQLMRPQACEQVLQKELHRSFVQQHA